MLWYLTISQPFLGRPLSSVILWFFSGFYVIDPIISFLLAPLCPSFEHHLKLLDPDFFYISSLRIPILCFNYARVTPTWRKNSTQTNWFRGAVFLIFGNPSSAGMPPEMSNLPSPTAAFCVRFWRALLWKMVYHVWLNLTPGNFETLTVFLSSNVTLKHLPSSSS